MRKKDLENTVERLAFWFMTIMRNLTAFTGLLRLEIDFNFSVSWLIKIVFRVISQTSENVLYVSDRWFRFRWCVTHALSRHVSWQVTSEWPMRLYTTYKPAWIWKRFCCTLQDRHADGRVMPKIDSQQDCELISLEEDNGKTTMKFTRKLDTCDPQDNKIEVGAY